MRCELLNVLFLCTGNSARSILSEALLNAFGSSAFKAYSAGSQPKPEPNPIAIETLRENGIPADSLQSKSWSVFESGDAPEMDIVITVCDNAAGETCPLWPGSPVRTHWSLPDPAAVKGSDSEKRDAFDRSFLMIKKRIQAMVELPSDRLGGDELAHRLNEIGAFSDD